MTTDELEARLKRTEDALCLLSIAAGTVLFALQHYHLDDLPIQLEDDGLTTTGHCLQAALAVARPVNAAMESD